MAVVPPSPRPGDEGATSNGYKGLVGCRTVMAWRGNRRWKVANNPNQPNEKKPQADRNEEQRRQQQQQGGQNRQPGSDQRPDQGRQNPQQR